MSENTNGFNSFFGFLMAAIGSAIGFGNIWGFPYKMGTHGGFAFLICYLVLCVFVGFIVMFSEIIIGRTSGCGPIGTYRSIGGKYHKRVEFVGWFAALSAVFMIGFYCSLGGYALKYCAANLGAIFGAGWGYHGESSAYFMNYVGSGGQAVTWTLLFLLLTALVCLGGVQGGIEKFCSIGMPVLFFLLVAIIIRSATLPGAGAGFAFIFRPDWSMLAGGKLINTLASSGGQMFFSLSLGAGSMITYGSYLKKDANLQNSAMLIVLFDTIAALMAACAVFPAVFAFGLEPAAGPGLLYVTMESVFSDMGTIGFVFGFLFYLLVSIAGISSSISMLEVPTVSLQEITAARGGKAMSRTKAVWIGIAAASVMNIIVSADGLGSTGMVQPLGFCWLDFFDLFAEGFMMPIGSLMMTLIVGYVIGRQDVLAEAELEGNKFPAVGFYIGCAKTVAPLGMLFILLGQMDSFFRLGLFS